MATRRLEIEIIGDPSSFSRSVGTVGRQVTALEQRFGRSGRAIQGAMGVAGGAVSRLGSAARTAAPFVGVGLAAGIAKSVSAASDLGEQVNKAAVVFEGGEKPILRWSRTTADAFGISREAALEAAGTFGNMLVPMGFARDEAAQMSQRMVELAADLASFNNASPEETLEALRAGLAGETEPLRRFGIFLNDARVAQEALGKKTATSTQGLSEQEKAAARLGVILKDTKDAQGDFGRTSDSLANQQRILRAQFENTAATLGQRLIPVAGRVAEVASGAISDVNKILSDPKLSDEQKFDAIADMIEDGFIDGLDRLGDLAPMAGKAAVGLAGRAASTFAKAWWDSDVWGKLFLTGAFIRAVGGPGVFGKLGRSIGGLVGRGLSSGAPSTIPGGGGIGGGFAAPGLTPAKPLYVRQVGPGGGGGGLLPVPAGGAGGTVGRLGLLARAIPGVGTAVAGAELLRSMGVNPGGDFDDRVAEFRKGAREMVKSMGLVSKVEKDVFRDYVQGLVDSGAASEEWAARQISNLNSLERAQRPVAAGYDFAKALAKDGKASDREIDKIIAKLGELPKGARKEAAETMIGVAKEFERKGRLPEGSAKRIRRDIVDEFGDMKVKSVGESVDMVKGIGRTFSGLVGVVTEGLDIIGSNTNEALQAFGVKPLKFALKSGTGLGGALGNAVGNAVGMLSGRAPGGRIPGYSAVDNHLIAVRGGERVLTPERQYPIADAAMWSTYGMGLDDMLQSTGGIMHARGGRAPAFAPGGIVPVPGFPGERINSRVLPAWQSLQKRFNLFLTDAYGPGHRSAEHTQFGTAVDVIPGPGGSWGDVGRAVAYSTRAGYTPVYYDGSHGSINLPPHGPGHHAHITLLTAAELAGGKRLAGGAGVGRLKRVALRGPKGPLRDLGQGALDRVRRGANTFIGKQAGRYGAHSALSGAAKVRGVMSQGQIASLWRQVNPGTGSSRLMSAIAMAESSGNPAAHGPPDGRGLYQIEWPIWGSTLGKYGNPYDAAANTRMARSVLQQQGLGAWVVYNTGAYRQFMKRGGRVPGFAGGGRNGRRNPNVTVGDVDLGWGQVSYGGLAGSGGGGGGGASSGISLAGIPYRNLPFEDRLAMLEIDLENAEQAGDSVAVGQITGWLVTLLSSGVAQTQDALDNLRLSKRQRRGVRRQSREQTADLKRKLSKDGLSKREKRRLQDERADIRDDLRDDILTERRSELIGELGSLTSALNGYRDSSAESEANVAEELKALREAIQEQNTIARTELAIGLAEARRALADIISGELGGREFLQAQTASAGSVHNY